LLHPSRPGRGRLSAPPGAKGSGIGPPQLRQRLQEKATTWEDAPRQGSEAVLSDLASVVDVWPDAVLAVDTEGQLAAYNRRFAELWGIPAETVGQGGEISTLLTLVAKATDKEDLLAALGDYRNLADIRSCDEVVLRDGRVLERYVAPAADRGGRSLGRVYVFRDVTERKRLEVELAGSRSALAEVEALTHIGSWSLDLKSRRLDWSAETYRIFGVDPALFAPSYEAFFTRVHPEDRAKVEESYQRSLANRTVFDCEHRILMNDGSIRTVRERGQTHYDNEGSPLRSLGTVLDITDQRDAEAALRGSEDKYRSLVESSPDYIFEVDAGMRFTYANPATQKLLGYTAEELADKSPFNFIRDEQDARELTQLVLKRLPISHVETTVRTTDGREAIVETSATPILGPDGSFRGYRSIERDITERKRAEVALKESRNFIEAILNAAPARIFWKDRNLVYLGCNAAFARDAGFSDPAEIIGKDDFQMGWKDQADLYRLDDLQVIDSGRDKLLIEEPQTTPDGRNIVLLTSKIPLRDSNGEIVGVLGTYLDITDRKQAQATILKMARVDALTGLANRNVFVEELARAIARARRSDKGLAVLYLDLDHFKDVNDTLGHPVGDELLKAVADRMRANVREIDTVARFGGDEFGVIMSELSDPAEAAVLAEKLLEHLAEPFQLNGDQILCGTSIGIATCGPDTPDAERLLTQADVALYRAKAEGRGTFRFFTEAMDREVKIRVALGNELREAIAAEQFSLYYQPEVEIETGRILGVEALVRWHHPRRGLIGPAEFIPAAEKSGLIIALGRWVLREACRQARQWIDLGAAPGFVAVNLSILQLKSTQDLENIAAAQAEFGLPPRMLELELTETVLMDASRRNSHVLQRLRDQGVRIAIDDFGTGYSSLEYLRRLTVDRVKIAQTFVADLNAKANSRAIVRAALGLARELGLGVVAEGVENAEQLDLLRAWGCREAQGFYFAKPQPAEKITMLLREGRISVPASGLAVSPSHRLRSGLAAKTRVRPSTPDSP